jgi:hypothetical protein
MESLFLLPERTWRVSVPPETNPRAEKNAEATNGFDEVVRHAEIG